MERAVTAELHRWKSNPKKKPLLISGVRQCGKTYVIKEFGTTSYSDMAYLNFESENLARLFEMDIDIDRIVRSLGLFRKKAISKNTLIVFDEIQICPRAITSLKYFCEDGRFDVIGAGSLLGVKLAESSPPVGKVEMITMYPLSFREFLWAAGEKELADCIGNDPFDPIIADFSERLLSLYREYLAVGGLPEAVSSWLHDHDADKVDSLLSSLNTMYVNDIARYGTGNVRENGELVWRSIPSQLTRDNNRFVFGHVREGTRARDLWSSVDWLTKAGLAIQVPVTVGNDVPAYTSQSSVFKLYCFDTGMLRYLAGVSIPDCILGLGAEPLFRGALTENYVLLELNQCTKFPIFCWRSGNKAEVDFVASFGKGYIPIEVKSSERTVAKSLGIYLDSHGGKGIIISPRTAETKERVIYVPLYSVWVLGERTLY